MRAKVALAAIFALSACVGTTSEPAPDGVVVEIQPTLPDGYPPKIGDVASTLDGTALAWTTYDYSVGAFDASVQVLGYDDKPELRLMAETAPSSRSNRLVMRGNMTSQLHKGALQDPLIEIIAGKDWDGARLTSAGGKSAEIVVDAITVDPTREVLGHIKGHFSASLCAADGPIVDRGSCHDISGTFESDMQFSGF